LFLKGEKERERERRGKEKSEEKRVKKRGKSEKTSLSFSLFLPILLFVVWHTAPPPLFKRTKKRKKGITNNKRTNEVFYSNALFRT